MGTFLMATHGTDGDVYPFIRVGGELRQRGHDVTLLTHAHYECDALRTGVEFVAVDTLDQFENTLARTSDLLDAYQPEEMRQFFTERELFNQFRDECEQLIQRHVPGQTVMVGRCTSDMSVFIAADVLGAPRATLALAPIQYLAQGGAATIFEEMAGEGINEIRAEFGLPPIVDWVRWLASADLDIGLWPRWFDLGGIMSPARARLTGFILPDEDEVADLPPRAATMLDGPVPPVLISGGTGRMLHREFYDIAVEACRLVGRPALLVVRHRDLVPDPLPEGIAWFPRLPFRDVMPRVAAVVHHGGIGTVARALTAGTPQVILAHGCDRPDNAARLAHRGLGSFLPAPQWSAQAAADLLRSALARGRVTPPGNPDPQAAVTATVDAVEKLLHRAPPHRATPVPAIAHRT